MRNLATLIWKFFIFVIFINLFDEIDTPQTLFLRALRFWISIGIN